MNTGINEIYTQLLFSIFKKYNDVETVVLYGSRAMGNFTKRSDIDLIIKDCNLDCFTISNILMDLEDSDLPYKVDLQIFDNIKI